MWVGADLASIVTVREMAGSRVARVIVPRTAKSMTTGFPGESPLALLIAARSEPAPELLRFVTTMDREDAAVKARGPAACAVAAPAKLGPAMNVQLMMQPAAMTRNRFFGPKRPAVHSHPGRNRDLETLTTMQNKVRRITTTPALLGYDLSREILGPLVVCAVRQSELHDTPNGTPLGPR